MRLTNVYIVVISIALCVTTIVFSYNLVQRGGGIRLRPRPGPGKRPLTSTRVKFNEGGSQSHKSHLQGRMSSQTGWPWSPPDGIFIPQSEQQNLPLVADINVESRPVLPCGDLDREECKVTSPSFILFRLILNLGCQITFYINHQSVSYFPPPLLLAVRNHNLLVGVLSAASNSSKRDSIRSTWFTYVGDWSGVFMVAITKDHILWPTILAEQVLYGDLLIVERMDDYDELYMKSTSLLWTVDKLLSFKWVLKTDDDSFVNIPFLLNLCEAMPAKKFYGGKIMRDRIPLRYAGRWFVSENEWKEEKYPPFAAGSGYLLSGDVVADISHRLGNCRFNHLEDVFIGGLVEDLGVEARDLPYIYCCDVTNNLSFYIDPESSFIMIPYSTILIKHYTTTEVSMKHFFESQQYIRDVDLDMEALVNKEADEKNQVIGKESRENRQ